VSSLSEVPGETEIFGVDEYRDVEIFYRLRDRTTYWSKIFVFAVLPTPVSFGVFVTWGFPWDLDMKVYFYLKKQESLVIRDGEYHVIL